MNRDFRYYWSAEVSSTFGSTFTTTAIGAVGVTVFAASPGELGFVSAAAILPACVFGLVAGVIGDRLRRPRRALIACDAAAALMVLAVAAGILTGAATIWWLAGLCLALGCLSTVVETVYFTHLRGLVPDDDLTAGRVRLQSGEYGARTVGQALAGFVIAAAGGAVALLLDALSYVTSLVLLTRIRTADHGAGEWAGGDAAGAGGVGGTGVALAGGGREAGVASAGGDGAAAAGGGGVDARGVG
ncbi:MFS transporter, partial [Amycolatopsis bartoniae]